MAWRAAPAAVFGLGSALVLDEFALILHLRDVYWAKAGRLSVDAVFVATGLTVLLLLGISPTIGPSLTKSGLHASSGEASAVLAGSGLVIFLLTVVTLLKGKIWTGLFGLFVPPLLVPGAIRLARPGSPWARWRYRGRPKAGPRRPPRPATAGAGGPGQGPVRGSAVWHPGARPHRSYRRAPRAARPRARCGQPSQARCGEHPPGVPGPAVARFSPPCSRGWVQPAVLP